MNLLFGKKETVLALADVLEDGRAIMNREMKKAKYNDYRGAELLFDDENQASLDRNPQLIKKP